MVALVWRSWWLTALLLLPLAACATRPPAPQARSSDVVVDHAPFALIFGRDPATKGGAGALPTAETALVLAVAEVERAGPVGLDAASAQEREPAADRPRARRGATGR